jgi:hypothetical protein
MEEQLAWAAAFTPRRLEAPYGWCGHIPFAAWLMGQLRPSVVVELGTHSGNSYFALCQAASDLELPTRLFAVDTWRGDEHAGWYGEEVYAQVARHNADLYAQRSTLMRMSFDEAVAHFADASIHLLHIDGLHTEAAVRHDFTTWAPKLAPGAVVLLHDTAVRAGDFGVWRLWEELRQTYPYHLEFLHSHGLGVLWTGPGEPPAWLVPESAAHRRVLEFFTAVGGRMLAAAMGRQWETQLSETQGQLVETQAQLAETQAQLVETQAQLVETQAQLTACLQSRSWRYTAPLRRLGAWARRIAR